MFDLYSFMIGSMTSGVLCIFIVLLNRSIRTARTHLHYAMVDKSQENIGND